MNFETFARRMKKLGFDEVVKRQWQPLTIVEEHSHPFDSNAIVVRGEMWLTVNGRTEHLLPGDTFELRAQQRHSERYGTEGATYWVARRNAPAS
jgi:mannose-6-phosphate isomerase-like protein (cupin superfamily)